MIATALAVAILIFGVGQLVLPPLAAHIARGRLNRYGRVISVSVSAFPAIELVFGDADTVNVKMAGYRASEDQVADNIGQAAQVTNLNLTAESVSSAGLTINNVRVTKRGNHFTGSGVVTEAALRTAIPLLRSVTAVPSSDGQLTLQGTSADLPLVGSVTADVNVDAQHGRVTAAASGVLGALLHLTVWSNPKVYVESLGGRAVSGGLALTGAWHLG